MQLQLGSRSERPPSNGQSMTPDDMDARADAAAALARRAAGAERRRCLEEADEWRARARCARNGAPPAPFCAMNDGLSAKAEGGSTDVTLVREADLAGRC